MNGSSSNGERRRDPRLQKSVPLKLSCDDGDFVSESGNISRSGVYCRVNQYIAPMMKLKVQLLLPVRSLGKKVIKKLSCRGVVVRSEPVISEDFYNVAIFFNEISQKNIALLTDYINGHLQTEQEVS